MRVQNFNQNLEESLKRLGAEIERSRDDAAKKELPERELVKQSFRALAARGVAPAPTAAQPAGDEEAIEAEHKKLLPDYVVPGKTDPEAIRETEELVEFAIHKDFMGALKRARSFPPFVEDAFHDALADKVVPFLKQKGLL